MNRIKQLRLEKDILQSELANVLKVRQNTVSNWETGRNEPDQQALLAMSKYFDVSIDYILGNSDLKKEPTQDELDSLTDLQKEIIALMGNMSQEQQKDLLEHAEYQFWRATHKKPQQ